jgi:hypothetical protein
VGLFLLSLLSFQNPFFKQLKKERGQERAELSLETSHLDHPLLGWEMLMSQRTDHRSVSGRAAPFTDVFNFFFFVVLGFDLRDLH